MIGDQIPDVGDLFAPLQPSDGQVPHAEYCGGGHAGAHADEQALCYVLHVLFSPLVGPPCMIGRTPGLMRLLQKRSWSGSLMCPHTQSIYTPYITQP